MKLTLLKVVPRRSFFGLPEKGMKGQSFVEFEQHKSEHAASTAVMWRRFGLWTGVPVLAAAALNAWYIEREHAEHLAHHPVKYKDLPYLHVRTKPFPWKDGNKSLFHNDHMQPPPEE